MSFNQAQKQAVTHDDGPCLVLAGPGSGNTLTSKARRNSGHYFYQICGYGNEAAAAGINGREKDSGYYGNLSRDLLRNSKVGI